MLRMFNFKCPHCQNEFERLVHTDTVHVTCYNCNKIANKFLCTPSFVVPGGYNPKKVI